MFFPAMFAIAILFSSHIAKTSADQKCFLEQSPRDTGCCFNEPELIPQPPIIQPQMMSIQRPVEKEVWTCRDFNRNLETCKLGAVEEICTTEFFKECKFIELPGKCHKVSHEIPGSCYDFCEDQQGDSKPRPSYDPPESSSNFGQLRQGRRLNDDTRCCNALVLNLGNSLRSLHSALETRFIADISPINGFKSWTSINGQHAIWHTSNSWCIGNMKDLGSVICSLHSTLDSSCPSNIANNNWNFWTGSEFDRVRSNEVNLNCLEGGRFKRSSYDSYGPPTCQNTVKICEYEEKEKCCNYPDTECIDVPYQVCTMKPTVICQPVTDESCTFVSDKIHVLMDDFVIRNITIPQPPKVIENWWCKKCEGEPFPAPSCIKSNNNIGSNNALLKTLKKYKY